MGGSGVRGPEQLSRDFLRLFGVSGFWILLTSVDGRGDPNSSPVPSEDLRHLPLNDIVDASIDAALGLWTRLENLQQGSSGLPL